MNVIKTKLAGVLIFEPKIFEDDRGRFVKIFNQDLFSHINPPFNLVESYYSTSKKNVIRGMHFQIPPCDHAKLVYVANGAIVDAVLDMRKGSVTYGHYITTDLNTQNCRMIFIPPGFAHGFLSLQDDTCVVYSQTSTYSPEHDRGIRFDSFGLRWGVDNPTISRRDQAFPKFSEFKTPFVQSA